MGTCSMMARRGVLGVLAGGAVAMLGGCGLFGGQKAYRFRMTVEVETPQGVKAGSSVYQVWAATNKAKLLPEEHARDWGVKGEAVTVDLGGGQYLFALMKTGAIQGDLAGMSMTALDPAFHNDIVESAARIAAGDGVRSPAEVARADWPLLVRFRNLADPKSVEQVSPEVARVKRIVVETTSDAVTTGIEKQLGWLMRLNGGYLDGSTIGSAANKGMLAGYFSKEIK